jgi:VanZ family protein
LASRRTWPGVRVLLGLALLLATFFALDPAPAGMPSIPFADKAAHLVTYLVLAALIDAGWPETGFTLRKWLVLLLYGFAIEVVQSTIPSRDFSLADVAANLAGVALYVLAVSPLLRRLGWR